MICRGELALMSGTTGQVERSVDVGGDEPIARHLHRRQTVQSLVRSLGHLDLVKDPRRAADVPVDPQRPQQAVRPPRRTWRRPVVWACRCHASPPQPPSAPGSSEYTVPRMLTCPLMRPPVSHSLPPATSARRVVPRLGKVRRRRRRRQAHPRPARSGGYVVQVAIRVHDARGEGVGHVGGVVGEADGDELGTARLCRRPWSACRFPTRLWAVPV